MPRFSANLWYLFQELDMMDRFEAAAKASFKGIEFHFPYAWPAIGKPANGAWPGCRAGRRNSAIPSA